MDICLEKYTEKRNGWNISYGICESLSKSNAKVQTPKSCFTWWAHHLRAGQRGIAFLKPQQARTGLQVLKVDFKYKPSNYPILGDTWGIQWIDKKAILIRFVFAKMKQWFRQISITPEPFSIHAKYSCPAFAGNVSRIRELALPSDSIPWCVANLRCTLTNLNASHAALVAKDLAVTSWDLLPLWKSPGKSVIQAPLCSFLSR